MNVLDSWERPFERPTHSLRASAGAAGAGAGATTAGDGDSGGAAAEGGDGGEAKPHRRFFRVKQNKMEVYRIVSEVMREVKATPLLRCCCCTSWLLA